MKRWNSVLKKEVERADVDAFLDEVSEVCRKHGFSISHEDGQGSFEITPYDEATINWLKNASIENVADLEEYLATLEAESG